MILPYVQPACDIPPWPPTGHIPDPVCRACGWERTNTTEPDGCLGWLPDTKQACCGHGRLYLKDGEITESTELWLDFDLTDSHGNAAPVIVGPCPAVHEAFNAWRTGDTDGFCEMAARIIGDGLCERLERRLKMITVLEHA